MKAKEQTMFEEVLAFQGAFQSSSTKSKRIKTPPLGDFSIHLFVRFFAVVSVCCYAFKNCSYNLYVLPFLTAFRKASNGSLIRWPLFSFLFSFYLLAFFYACMKLKYIQYVQKYLEAF